MITSPDILNARILIVDDLEANVSLLEQMLSGAGYTSVASTREPRKVCDLHREENYSLIILDLMMPGMDGFEVMAGLKQIETDGYLPVLVITAQPSHNLRALKAGAKDFISKPFELAEVLIRVHNMLEVRLLHLETRKLSDRLKIANEELESFSYSVAHDLRAPLRRVRGFVGLLKKDIGPSSSVKSQHHLDIISKSIIRMGCLIDDLLTFSRVGREELKKTQVSLNPLVQELISESREGAVERDIVWNIHSLPTVKGDRALLRLALSNLISNAVKFTGARSHAKIEVGSSPGADDETVIFIRDNGAGFDPEYAGKLFGVFQRLHTQKEFEGTGIGLANVQRIIRRHGGLAWAEGVVDVGATFYFSLPK